MSSAMPWSQSFPENRHTIKVSERELILIFLFLYAINRLGKNEITVMDIGGGNGYMAYCIRRHFPNIKFVWVIAESESMADAYTQFESDAQIKWIPSGNIETNYDIVLISCTLQYLETPKIILDNAFKQCEYLILMRVPLIDGPRDVITVQKTLQGESGNLHASWPCWFFSEESIFATLDEQGKRVLDYECVDESVALKEKIIKLRNFLYEHKK